MILKMIYILKKVKDITSHLNNTKELKSIIKKLKMKKKMKIITRMNYV